MTDTYLSIKTFPIKFKKTLSDSYKNYKLIRLSNGLLTLLISDPSSDKSACSLCVSSGTHKDPVVISGLAHLCEHMLFLGTKEFPKPHEFFEIIGSNNGNSNAFTTGEHTCFFFEVPTNDSSYNNQPLFDGLLENFSSFFKKPLFSEFFIRREVVSVNDEHISNLNNVNKIFYQSLRLLSNKNHPFSRFGTGNLFTLNESPKISNLNLRTELVNYFNNNYLSNKMTLVLKGPQSLNHLQKLSILNFSDIKSGENLNNNFFIDEESYEHRYSEPTFTTSCIKKLLFINSNIDSRLRLIFPITNLNEFDDIDVYIRIWCSLLGDESKGSLCDYLINKKNYINSLYVFNQRLSYNDSVLTLDIELVRNGERNLKNLVTAIFRFINQIILNINLADLSKYLNEFLTISKLKYYFKNVNSSSLDEVSKLSETLQSNLKQIGFENILRGYKDFDDNDINYSGDLNNKNIHWWMNKSTLFLRISNQVLSINNFNLIVINSNKSIISSIVTDSNPFKKDMYYLFDYTISPVDLDLFKSEISHPIKEFRFPGLNKFLLYTQVELNNLINNLVTNPLGFQTKSNPLTNNVPQLIDFSRKFEIWYKQEFEVSFKFRILTSSQFQSFSLSPSPLVNIGLELICELLGNEIRYKLYPAEQIGYSWGLFPNLNSTASITLFLSGLTKDYNLILKFIVNEIIELLSSIDTISYKKFMKARVNLRKEYEGLLNGNGIKQSVAGSFIFLEEHIWTLEERIESLELIDLNNITEISNNLLKSLKYTKILINGDCKISKVFEISKIINILTHHESIVTKKIDLKEPSSYLIKPGRNYIFEALSNKNDPLNTINYYNQLGLRDDAYIRTLGKLIAYILSNNINLELRTKKQLGYSISSGLRLNRSTLGVYVIIMSGNYDTNYLLKQIEVFLFEWELTLLSYNDIEFKKIIIDPFLKSLRGEKSDEFCPNLLYAIEPSKHGSNFENNDKCYNIHKKYWDKILNKTYRSKGLNGDDDIDLAIIENLTRGEFIDFFRQKLSIKSKSKSSLTITVKSTKLKDEVKQEQMKTQLYTYLIDKGFSITIEETELILENCKYNSNLLSKELFKFFKSKDEGFKFLLLSIRDLSKSIVDSIKITNIFEKNSDEDSERFKILRQNAVKNFGDEYSSNEPVLPSVTLKTFNQLHDDSLIVNVLKNESIYDKLTKFDLQYGNSDSFSEDDTLNLNGVV